MAGVQLDRVRQQQQLLLNPSNTICNLGTFRGSKRRLDRDLDLSGPDVYIWAELAEHVCVGISIVDNSKMVQWIKNMGWWRYLPEELANLQDDDNTRQVYLETWRHVLVPKLRDIALIIRTQAHLLAPSAQIVETPMYKMFTGKNVLGDNTKLVYPGGMLTFHYIGSARCFAMRGRL